MTRLPAVAGTILLLAAGTAGAAERQATSELPLLAAPPGPEPAPPHSADADAATYQHCMTLARDDPAAARKLAESWHRRGGAHPALHCLAMSLIGLGQYKEAADHLEALAQAMIHAPASLRASVLGQAAQAWLLAGDAGRAYAADGAALSLHPDDAELLVDRAEAAGSAGWYDKAVADLDRVLKADPERIDALIYRASAYSQLGRLDLALADIEQALRKAPDSAPALLQRGDIRLLRGDRDGARQDWQRAAVLSPGSQTANVAQANIARLARSDAAPPAPTAKPGSTH